MSALDDYLDNNHAGSSEGVCGFYNNKPCNCGLLDAIVDLAVLRTRIAELEKKNNEFGKIIDDYSGKEFQWNKENARLQKVWSMAEKMLKKTLKIGQFGWHECPEPYENYWKQAEALLKEYGKENNG